MSAAPKRKPHVYPSQPNTSKDKQESLRLAKHQIEILTQQIVDKIAKDPDSAFKAAAIISNWITKKNSKSK